jgi:hypothetical protein
MPLWVILLVFASAGVEAAYPGVNIIDILSQPWVEALLVGTGLGGIPLSMFKRVVGDAKTSVNEITKP